MSVKKGKADRKWYMYVRTYWDISFLTLLEQKVISLSHKYRARPACTFVQSNQALYCWLANFSFSF